MSQFARTPRELEQFVALVRDGYQTETVEHYINKYWRSEVHQIGRNLYCACCEQLISHQKCEECGLFLSNRG